MARGAKEVIHTLVKISFSSSESGTPGQVSLDREEVGREGAWNFAVTFV